MTLTHRDGGLAVEVADTGRPILRPRPPVPAGARRGLVGLRERLVLYGGVLDAGLGSGGGSRVRTRFAVDPAAPPRQRAPAGRDGLAGRGGAVSDRPRRPTSWSPTIRPSFAAASG